MKLNETDLTGHSKMYDQILCCLNHKTWTGLTVEELAKAGRLVVRKGQNKQNLHDLVDEVIGEMDVEWKFDLVDLLAETTVVLYESNYPSISEKKIHKVMQFLKYDALENGNDWREELDELNRMMILSTLRRKKDILKA